MQLQELDFVNINTRAHITIEKCNHVTKGKNCPTSGSGRDAALHLVMQSAVFVHASYATLLPCMRGQPWADILEVQRIHRVVSTHSLPSNVLRMQARHIVQVCGVNTNCISQSTMLFVCLRCACNAVKFVHNKKMRVMSDGCYFCPDCNEATYMLRISTLGRIVQVRAQYFYFCSFCCCTHEWVASGHEFSGCRRVARVGRAATPSTCSMCARSTSLCTWPVLDDGVGAVRQLLLCPKHKLLLHQQDNVYNIQTLRLAVLHKLNSYRVSALEIKSL